ncbi:MAG: hypothetical protein A2017_02095 [Lentisphaerae bacterium GWF2_44_16]|nr:MAG: hypothetical protein A2017_02095 [Lentisphaerae bacterium GWF2_44_16]
MERINEKDKVICIFKGNMDTVACRELETELVQMLNHCKADNLPLVLDLAEVDYIASSFLRICIMSAQQLGKENVNIVNVTHQVKKVFKMAGLSDDLSVS